MVGSGLEGGTEADALGGGWVGGWWLGEGGGALRQVSLANQRPARLQWDLPAKAIEVIRW
jgi:hypothetical protein